MVATAARNASARGKKKTHRARRPPTAPANWWGDGLAPHLEWPGVTIEIPAVWNTKAARWESQDGKYYFDTETADRACDFFPTFLTHHIGAFAGLPFELLPYQKKLLTRPLFGWKRSIDGLRRFRRVFSFIPKGGGKSPWAAGTSLYGMLCDDEPAAEVYALANDRKQARVVHENAKIMVEDSPDLQEMCEVLKDTIACDATRSSLQVLSSDATGAHGFRPHIAVFDEFHGQPNRDLFEAIKKSMVKRRQPILIMISHAGDDDEGICYEEYEYAKKVLSGTAPDEAHLPVMFEASSKDDWTDPAVWRRVNPGHGITVQSEGIAAECEEAKVEPRKLNDFLRFHLNRWVNQATAWIPIDWWDACTDPMPTHDELRALPVAFGLDNAQKIDLACGVALFRLPLKGKAPSEAVEVLTEENGTVVKRTRSLNYRIAIVPTFWLPEDTLEERVKQDGIRYDVHLERGELVATEGPVIDTDRIVRHIIDPEATSDLVRQFPLLKQGEFGYDPAFATDIAIHLSARGLTTVEVLQNYKHLSEACQVLEALLKAKRVVHGGHKLMRWCVENVMVKRDDAGRIRPVKPKNRKRIDGVVAVLIALSRLMVMPEPKRPRKGGLASVWTPQGFTPASGATDTPSAGDGAHA